MKHLHSTAVTSTGAAGQPAKGLEPRWSYLVRSLIGEVLLVDHVCRPGTCRTSIWRWSKWAVFVPSPFRNRRMKTSLGTRRPRGKVMLQQRSG